MKARLLLPKWSSLYDEFNEAIGEIVSTTELHAYVRVELKGHTEFSPSYALILIVWEHIEIIESRITNAN